MSVLKVIDLPAQLLVGKMQHKSDYQSFKSLKNVKSVYVKNQSAAVSDGKISRTTVKVTFELE
jgi:flavin-binding protein dodecin